MPTNGTPGAGFAEGGLDTANLYDSAADDLFYAYGKSDEGALFGDGFYNRAKFFEVINAFSNEGGEDNAFLNDSPSTDLLTVNTNGDEATLKSEASNELYDYLFTARDFDFVTVLAGEDNEDTDYRQLPELDKIKFALILDEEHWKIFGAP